MLTICLKKIQLHLMPRSDLRCTKEKDEDVVLNRSSVRADLYHSEKLVTSNLRATMISDETTCRN